MYASISSWLLFLIPLDYKINEGRGHFWLCLSSSGTTRNTVSAPYRSQCSDWSFFFESTIVAHYLGKKLLDFVFLFFSSCSFIQQHLMAPAEKTFESPSNRNKIKAVNPKENQSWILIGRTAAEAETLILWPPDSKNWLILQWVSSSHQGTKVLEIQLQHQSFQWIFRTDLL